MNLKKLGNSDVSVTPLAFGAWAIGGWMWGGAEEQAAIKAVRTALTRAIYIQAHSDFCHERPATECQIV